MVAFVVPLLDNPIVVVDVGCRWGFADAWLGLGDRGSIIGFDPDVEECRRLEERYADRAGVHVIPQGLGSRPGPATLHITKDPAGSSLYRPHPDTYGLHPDLDGAQPERTIAVELVTLDAWWAVNGPASADVIKLDTQGSELDILRGASDVLESVRAVEVEVEFNPLYEEQPLFGDVDAFLRRHGFMLWKLRNLVHYSQWGVAERAPRLGQNWFDSRPAPFDECGGQLYWCDAFFVAQDLARPSDSRSWQELLRDAVIAHALQFDDLATRLVLQARANAPTDACGALDAALVWLRDQTAGLAEHAAAPGAPSAPPTVTLDLRDPIVGQGWDPPAAEPAAAGRAARPGAAAWVDFPVRVPAGTAVTIHLTAPMALARWGDVSVEVNGLPVTLEPSADDPGDRARGRVPSFYASVATFTRVMVRSPISAPDGEPAPEFRIAAIDLAAPGN